MILAFDDFEIDPQRSELRNAGVSIPVETRVFNLLYLLVKNHDRLVTKDEIIEIVWDGRAISDSAISTAIKEARKALGDDGTRQAVIATVHGRGFRCIAPVKIRGTDNPAAPEASLGANVEVSVDTNIPTSGGKPSIAVLPFQILSTLEEERPLADAIPAELISALSRLRWINVIARGSSFQFREPDVSPITVRQLLGASYCLTGIVEVLPASLAISVELVETRQGSIVWGERYISKVERLHEVRSEIIAGVISAIEVQVPLAEADAARILAPQQLDAWSEYHLGLQHMYRFNRADNAAAMEHFREAIAKDPRFARAHAGLSFTHFQNAFMNYEADREHEIDAARSSAETSLELDPLDPFANYNMGRVCWLTGELESGSSWLDRSLQISPNFAQGHYVKALLEVLAGHGEKARESSATAMSLSPLDPLYYAMLGSHAQSYLCDGNYTEAAIWAERAARAPGAHHLLATVAAIAHHLNDDDEKARYWADNVRTRRPDMNALSFFNAFPFAEGPLKEKLGEALAELGF
jgi:TolB-like protein/tetratricopeptide (TPR) repeat protein